MLGAGPFTLATVDAVGGFAPALDGPGVGFLGLVRLVPGQLLVGGGEDLGDEDLPGAALYAVAAAGAGDGRRVGQDLLGFGDGLLFRIGHRAELGEGGQVVLHLGQVGHARQHRQDAVQAGGKPQSPGGIGHPGPDLVEQILHVLGRVGQGAALHRLHDHNLFAVGPGHPVVLPRGDLGVIPVGVVDLQLDKVHVGVLGQQLVQQGRGAVEGKAVMADQAPGLLLLHEIPQVPVVVVLDIGILDGVKQVVIKIAGAGPGQALFQLLLGLFLGLGHPGVQLGGQGVAVPGVALHQGLADGILAAGVDIGRIKISKTRRQEGIHHLAGLGHINFLSHFGQPHQAEAQRRMVCCMHPIHPFCRTAVRRLFA